MQKKIQVDFPSEFEATYTFFPRNQILMKLACLHGLWRR